MANHHSLAKDLFEDMGRKVAEASAQDEDEDGTKVVDEIESLCMNCHENVSSLHPDVICMADSHEGHYTASPYQNPLLP